ncbi:HAD-IA family hydrolase [Paraglaciecola aquimarina]|uniref:HAD-IA family hydrolase n=1 Tax=Paraglaciecola aquimarina TaxID=1235557 RepID=A0ABU3SZ78_9ALTE|nr:HAD-IA family hydrolase [Paraglaciecola aquimarina]MDU0355316.1 HAD-IA family hydrolase [Paraglaciecola aquimarina]
MKYKAIIFDWDGTLMDSIGKIVETMQSSAKELGFPVPDYEQAKNVIGLSLLPALQTLFNVDDEKVAMALFHTYKAQFKAHLQISSPLFEGALALLEELTRRGYILAVATGKARQGLEHNWLHSKTEHFFSASRTADDAQSKPSPDMLEQLLKELALPVEQVLMVGDTTYDMAMAEAINMDRIGVSFGVHSAQELSKHKPLAVIDSLQELLLHV